MTTPHQRTTMRIRKITTIIAIGAATAVATVPAAADARQGADDPVGHVRHSGADDGVRSAANRTRTKTRTRTRTHGRHHTRHHGAGHVRHGADDGPNHT